MSWRRRTRGMLFSTTALAAGAGVALTTGAVDLPQRWVPPAASFTDLDEVDADAVADRLAGYLRLPTVHARGTDEGLATAVAPHPPWQAYLLDTWVEPLDLRWEAVEGGLAIFVDSPDPRPPVLWLSHADVVPVDEAEVATWTHPPFSGAVADGFVWGRGALDNKSSTVVQLEAVRHLLERGEAPSRDVVLLVTPDEEVGGGTSRVVAGQLDRLGGPVAVLDEGSVVVDDMLDGTRVAAVAVGERASVTYDLVARGASGHSSMAAGPSAAERLARAMVALHEFEPDARLLAPMIEGFVRLAPERDLHEALALANASWLAPLLTPFVASRPGAGAITTDSVAVTMIQAGVKENVVPHEARAVVNARLLPGTDPGGFTAALRAAIDDPLVELVPRGEPVLAGLSRWDTDVFRALEAVAPRVLDDAVVIPSMTAASMDARWFAAAGLDAYRFHPFVLDAGERARIHGRDERISLENLGRGVRFYHGLLQEL